MIKPKALKSGDTIGVIAPSSGTGAEQINKGKKALEEMGFSVFMSEGCDHQNGYLAGSDDQRVKDLHEMFTDHRVNGIICLKGGYGTPRILDRIDTELIKTNPKVFMGYSDITALHLLINQKASLVTFHGPMVASEFSKGLDRITMDAIRKSLMNPEPAGLLKNPEGEEIHNLVNGKAEGRITGGNLALVTAMMGTPYEVDTKGKILFLEEIGEDPYRIDRMLTQLRLGGKLKEAEGIIFGDFKDCESSKHEDVPGLKELLQEFAMDAGVPSIYNLQSGHCLPHLVLPLGVNVILDATEGTVMIEEGGVESDDQ